MKKDESRGGGLLAKMVRFVRHPTVDWSELDAPRPGEAAQPGREALKAVLESKRRNDQVRAREFDMLRELIRQRQAAQAMAEGNGRESGLLLPDAPATGNGAGSTVEKIARIEAQMSRHWLGRGEAADQPQLHIAAEAVPSRHDGGITVPGHLQSTLPMAFPEDAPPVAASVALELFAEDFAALGQAPAQPQALQTFPALEEAAVRFASGDDQAAEAGLRAALAQEAPGSARARLAWEAMLDYFVCTGQPAAFGQLADEFAARHGRPAPGWPAAPGEAAPPPAWICPPVLDAAAVRSLGAVLAAAGQQKWLDWGALVSADLAAAQALLELLERWLEQPVEFHFVGADVLRQRLKASTPSGRRENDPLWWRLRLALLRLMQRIEEFDLAALDFCVTYGVLPPDWQEPRSRYCQDGEARRQGEPGAAPGGLAVEPEAPAVVEPIRPLATQLGGLDVLEWPAMSSDTRPLPAPLRPAPAGMAADAQLGGALGGDIEPALRQLQAALERHGAAAPFTIDCRALTRVDLAAAGSLLQWLLGALAQGARPELAGVNRLVAAFFHVVGLDEVAAVRLREY